VHRLLVKVCEQAEGVPFSAPPLEEELIIATESNAISARMDVKTCAKELHDRFGSEQASGRRVWSFESDPARRPSTSPDGLARREGR
jgi:hypothetical protein